MGTGYSQQVGSGIYSLGISDDAKIAFNWTANSESNLAGYKLYIGTLPGLYSTAVDAGMVTTYQLPHLIRGMTYYFALTAYNTAGLESDFTPELMYDVPWPVRNAPPTLDAISDITLPEDAGPQIIALTGISSGRPNELQALTISARSSNPDLIPHPAVNYSSPGVAGSMSIQPLPSSFGTAVITVTISDGQLENSEVSRSFPVTVQPVNDPPYFEPIADIVVEEGASVHSVLLSGVHAGAPNERDDLTITASSSQTNLVQMAEVVYFTRESSALLLLSPTAGVTGTATITATANDGNPDNGTFSRTFGLTIVNTPPIISAIADQFILKNTASGPILFTVSDPGTPAASLRVTAASSNPTVVPLSGLILGGSDNNRTLIIDPANGRSGPSIITLTVTDGSASASISFQVTVDSL
jgi:hypothetical protein